LLNHNNFLTSICLSWAHPGHGVRLFIALVLTAPTVLQAEDTAADQTNGLATAEQEPPGSDPSSWFILTLENDLFVLTDDGYTNGISVGWGQGPYETLEAIGMPNWLRAFFGWTYIDSGADKDYVLSYRITQGMYTPTDISDPEPILDDRPYAGTLTWEGKIRNYDGRLAQALGLELGVVGPASFAEQTQKLVHEISGSATAQGWDNQIGNEAVFRIDGERIQQLGLLNGTNNIQFDSTLYMNAGLGNLRSDVGTGLIFRVGTGLAESFAFVSPAPDRGANTLAGWPSTGFDWQLAFSAYGRYVFNDITLDGNTFKDSQSIELKNEQIMANASLATRWQNWGFIFSLHRGSNSFVGQVSTNKYGAVSITYNY
jgi:lipid A 3-O-deacylase